MEILELPNNLLNNSNNKYFKSLAQSNKTPLTKRTNKYKLYPNYLCHIRRE